MDFKLKYNIDSNELEPSVAEKYRQAITKCRESDDSFESLESLNYALESLEDSFAASGREIEWEMIKAYRNLCRVYREICSSKKYADYDGIIDFLEEKGIDNVAGLDGAFLDSDILEERVEKSIKNL